MINNTQFQHVVMRANLAPSVHNIQPARWRIYDDHIEIAADLSVGLQVGDPDENDAGLSCGAAVEATLLALSAININATVTDLWRDNDRHSWPRHRMAARLLLMPGTVDLLHKQLEKRFTWRAAFTTQTPALYGWSRDDTALILDMPSKAWFAARNDWASLEIMQNRAFRRELTHWMRLSPGHPRYHYDGLSREALQMPVSAARATRWVLGPFWRVLNLFGVTKGITAEANITQDAAVIGCFHREVGESPVTSGRAYLRLCLEASNLGFAGWPMAALSDHLITNNEILERFALGADRNLIQVIRFGRPTGTAPPRARRPISELIPTYDAP